MNMHGLRRPHLCVSRSRDVVDGMIGAGGRDFDHREGYGEAEGTTDTCIRTETEKN